MRKNNWLIALIIVAVTFFSLLITVGDEYAGPVAMITLGVCIVAFTMMDARLPAKQ